MNSTNQLLSTELRRLIESRLRDNLDGIEKTLRQVFELQNLGLEDLKDTIEGLEESFTLLSQKWSLQILYTLFLKKTAGFIELKKILNINSRTLSDKLKILSQSQYIKREIQKGPPLRVKYSLTQKGRDTILLALPFLYYSSSSESPT